MSSSQIHPWHETFSSLRSVIQDGVALSFLFRWTSCVEGTVLSRGGPLGYFMGGIITYTSASHPQSSSTSLERSPLFFVSCLGSSGSTAQPSGSTVEESQAQYRSAAVVPPVTPQQYYRWPAWHHRLVLSLDGEIFSLSCLCLSGSTALPTVVPPKGHKRQYRSAAVVPPMTPLLYYRWAVWLLPPRLEGSFSRVGSCSTSCGSRGGSTALKR